MADRVVVTTRQSWLGRIGGSIVGAVFGVVMVLAGFPVLFLNEGRAIQTARSLDRGARQVIEVTADTIDPAHDGALVHVTGRAETAATLEDAVLGVSANALALKRNVEMYQWRESSTSESRTKLGGGQDTVTTYTYDRDWSDEVIDSAAFHEPDGHDNPAAMPFESASWTADHVTLGAFTVPTDIVGALGDGDPLAVPASAATGDRRVSDGGLYIGANPAAPAVGDVRITYSALAPGTISLVAAQSGDTFEPFTGAGKPIQLAAVGDHTAAALFADARSANALILWALRLLGYLLMAFGLMLAANPLAVVGDVIPFVGRLLGLGVMLVGFVLALPLALLTIAAGWLTYRPLVALGLTVAAAAVGYAATRVRRGAAGGAA